MNTDTLKERCTKLLVDGQKIQAIKLWREHTGTSLKDAKGILEHFENTGSWLPSPKQSSNSQVDTITTHNKAILNQIDNLRDKCTSLLENGNKIGAIKEWRKHTGASLKDAKEAIEQLERDHSTPRVGSVSRDEYEEYSAEEEKRPHHQQGLGAGYWLVLLGLCGYFVYYLLA